MGLIISSVAAVVLIYFLFIETSDVLFWCKWIISYIYIQIKRKSEKNRFDLYDVFAKNDPVKVDFISPPEEKILESPLNESQLYTTADEVFFYGVNSKNECLVTRIARSCNHEAEAWIYLKLSTGEVYQLKETTSYQQSSSEKKTFSCGGLQLHYMTPMRRWRIFFNGLLKKLDDSNSDEESMKHIKFSLIWRASSDVFDFTTDTNANLLAKGFAKTKWDGLTPPYEKLNNALNFYAQAGIIMGTINIEGSEEEKNIYLFGERARFLGQSSLVEKAEFVHLLGRSHKTGSFVHLGKVSIKNIIQNFTFGFFVRPAGEMCFINDVMIDSENKPKMNETDVIKGYFEADEILYGVKGHLIGEQARFESKKGWDGKLTIDCVDFQMNAYNCSGVSIKGAIFKPIENIYPKVDDYKIPAVVPLVVPFSEKMCQYPSVTGGKGSSLGKLTELSKEFKNFIVPNGIVVTTAAYEMFINKEILQEIRNLENVLYGNANGDVQESCKSVSEKVEKLEIPQKLQEDILTCIEKTFTDHKTLKFAVRSSATGEDTEQMSAAGQMETYLGVTGNTEILNAVKKCWASQFGHIAVQYKRQNGQVINSPMAVVIQEMIPCDVAGVLFTCCPLTGNPTTMSITANYGLGESVVSASEEPDSLELKRDFNDTLSIKSKIIGSKNRRIVLQGDKGTTVEEISKKERESCCLTDEMAVQLGKLAIKIERSYRSHRDIEWGFWNNDLYIFQSRPVTSGSGETDFEIEHELDAPLRIENEYFTMCNVGEVMPGAFSFLGLDILIKFFRITFHSQKRSGWSQFKSKYFPRGIISMYNHVMFLCVDLFERMNTNKDISDAMFVSLFGRVIEDEELFEIARDRFKKKEKSMIMGILQFYGLIKMLFGNKRILTKTLKEYSNYRVPFENYKMSRELFDALLYRCTDLTTPMVTHMVNTEASSIWNMFIFNILKKARGEISSEVYTNFSQLLTTSSEVESADVPAGIENLASYISKEIKPDEFKKMNAKDIVEWLQTSKTEAGIKYREFLSRHGHRSLKEFDIHTKTWGDDPRKLVKLLQNIVGNATKNLKKKKDEDYDKIISDLGIDFGFKTRILLKFLIPKSRQGVQNREMSKSLLIKSEDAWRKAYYHLAKLMVSEGRIPDEDVLFFMTIDEINELLETRSPKIISRANHRRRRHPVMEKYIFPEIMKGFPKPVNMEETEIKINEDHFTMKGIPVSKGIVKAYVRVALTLEEAASLKPGEILLTYSTDIGWSPYFPILGGVVTELGGLISHGAVVSREYGLPCIAGLHGATREFQTGDYVLLDGNKGILQKLPKPENVETEL